MLFVRATSAFLGTKRCICRPMPSMWGVGRSLFTLWLEVPIKDRHYNPIRSLVANGRVDEHESLGSDDSVFFFSRCFAAKTGNITGYRCCPGGRKELLVVVHNYNLATTSGALWVHLGALRLQLGHNSCPLFTPLTQRCAGQLGTVVLRGNSCHLPGDGCCQRNRSGSSFLFLLFVYL